MTCQLIHADCRDALRLMTEASVDAIVTDPPYELGFMGKGWDRSGIAYSINLWRECLRVLKPGGHLLAFGGTRTYHRMACAIEDAGFEIRDSINWLYGSGFPKSLDVSKAIDKAAGAEREVVGSRTLSGTAASTNPATGTLDGSSGVGAKKDVHVTAPATDAAKQWEGWGTALKPAYEPIVVARKPLAATVAANVLAHGTGALNIDGCRVGFASEADERESKDKNRHADFGTEPGRNNVYGDYSMVGVKNYDPPGRWPANVILDDAVADAHPDWARYFYCAKPSKAERNAGLDGLPAKFAPTMNDGIGGKPHNSETATPKQNIHPTVKPVALMRWLVRLVTPPNGIVLDPFAGSGTTLVAAVLEGFNAIGIEMTDDYLPIINGRIAWAEQQPRDLFGGAA